MQSTENAAEAKRSGPTSMPEVSGQAGQPAPAEPPENGAGEKGQSGEAGNRPADAPVREMEMEKEMYARGAENGSADKAKDATGGEQRLLEQASPKGQAGPEESGCSCEDVAESCSAKGPCAHDEDEKGESREAPCSCDESEKAAKAAGTAAVAAMKMQGGEQAGGSQAKEGEQSAKLQSMQDCGKGSSDYGQGEHQPEGKSSGSAYDGGDAKPHAAPGNVSGTPKEPCQTAPAQTGQFQDGSGQNTGMPCPGGAPMDMTGDGQREMPCYGQGEAAYGQQEQTPFYGQGEAAYGQQAQTPFYGQGEAAYGQQEQTPFYGQGEAAYGQQAQTPFYGQGEAAYGQQEQTPCYGQGEAAYGQQAQTPGYSGPMPYYGHGPVPGYGQGEMSYGFGPMPGNGQGPMPGYSQSEMIYGQGPMPGYGPGEASCYAQGPMPGCGPGETSGYGQGPMPGYGPEQAPGYGQGEMPYGQDQKHGCGQGDIPEYGQPPGGNPHMHGQKPQGCMHGFGQGPGHPKHDANKHGQFMGLVNDIANGDADASTVINFLASLDPLFWKGALMGAVAALLLTNDSVKSSIGGAMSGVMGAFDKDSSEEKS